MKKTTRLPLFGLVLFGLVALSLAGSARAWQESYEKALKAAEQKDWNTARAAFQESSMSRGQDFSGPTRLPGPLTEPQVWRRGAPYSPNFGAAYCAYKLGITAEDNGVKTQFLTQAAEEFRMLLEQQQASPETIALAKKAYQAINNEEGLKAVSEIQPNDWKVDTAMMEAADIVSTPRTSSNTTGQTTTTTSQTQSGATVRHTTGQDFTMINVGAADIPNYRDLLPGGAVATVSTKYALLIGNTETRIEDHRLTYAAQDVAFLKTALTTYGGYEEGNVTLLTDVTAQQMREAVAAFAAELPQDATVFLYFTGVGVSVDGRDYMAGTDTEFVTDVSKMVSKREVYQAILDKGAAVFSFFQTDRNIVTGNHFGKERTVIGRISEAHATIPGEKVNGFRTAEGEFGLYTYAMVKTLETFLTNQIAVDEFCWEVFYRIRRGGETLGGGGSYQTPTLPTVTNMPANARF